MKKINIYTDGCCLGNPGSGGYGAILRYKEHQRELFGGYQLTTNNRMEIIACIAALGALEVPCSVTLFTDSQYVVNSINKNWAHKWRQNGWRKSDGKYAENFDLWERLLNLTKVHDVSFHWVRGHAGHIENERCDQLAKIAANGSDLLEDAGYLMRWSN